ncbi:MAG: hypothetical protein WKF84_22160 [Pyrinomonadaceae bacterium]
MFNVELDKTRDKAFILANSASHTTSEIRYLAATDPKGQFKVVQPRENLHEYYVDHHGGLFYIRTNKGAKNYRIVTTPVANPNIENWKELVAHRADVKHEDADFFVNHMVIYERTGGLPKLRVTNLKSK